MWGEGFLSPGGPDEVAQILSGVDLRGRRVLDIGCGIGGVDIVLVREHGAREVVGIDVEPALVAQARDNARQAGCAASIDFRVVEPGSLGFAANTFDVVFSKDSMVHIPDKTAIYTDIRRVLKPQGALAVSDWFGSEQPATPEMNEWLELVNLTFSLGTLRDAADILRGIGFDNIEADDRNTWYSAYMNTELASITGDKFADLVARVGQPFAEHRVASSTLKKTVVEQGQLRPGHLRAINQKQDQ